MWNQPVNLASYYYGQPAHPYVSQAASGHLRGGASAEAAEDADSADKGEKPADPVPWRGLYPQLDQKPDSFYNQAARPDSAYQAHGPQRQIQLGQYMSANSESGHVTDGADNLSLSVGKEAARTGAAARNNHALHVMQQIIDNEPLTGDHQTNRLGSSTSTIENGQVRSQKLDGNHDVSQNDLRDFAYQTLENARKNNAEPWLELSGHGQADGILRDKDWQNLKPEQLGAAIKDANDMYAKAHPGEKNPKQIYGVINNGCLGNSVDFQDALGRAGVQRYVASPNTIAGDSPGMLNELTSEHPDWQKVADAATHSDGATNPDGTPAASPFAGSTVVDVSDLSNGKGRRIKAATDAFDDSVHQAMAKDPKQAEMLRRATSGLVEAGTTDGAAPRAPDAESRFPSLSMYDAIANTTENIDPSIRSQAGAAAKAIRDAQLAHSYNAANEGVNDEGDNDHNTKGATFIGPLVTAPWLTQAAGGE